MKAKRFRKLLCIVATAALFAIMICPVTAETTHITANSLSSMSEEQCIEFIISNGIDIPDDFVDLPQLGTFVQGIIQAVEANPNYMFAYGYSVTQSFADSIKVLVNSYTGRSDSSSSSGMGIDPPYTLIDSTLYGAWDDSYVNYNCYLYAIGITSNPGKDPGTFSGGGFNINKSVYEIALLVKRDLESVSLGSNCVTTVNARPATLNNSEKMICVRKGVDVLGAPDYHFMRFSNGNWYHKPSFTAILKYNYQPSNNLDWTNERFWDDRAWKPDTTYSGEIYYIIYKASHSSAYGFTGEHYHSGFRHYAFINGCSDCGIVSNWESWLCLGPPCSIM